MRDLTYSNGSNGEEGPFVSPFSWDAASQVGLPTLRDQLAITAASEFDFWQPPAEWLTSLVEATLTRLHKTP